MYQHTLMISDNKEQKIIEGCIAGKRHAHNLLYKKYASKMLGVCIRYCKSISEAEDVLQDGFIKIFSNIKNYRNDGSFEGWMKRIIINTALNNYHKNLKYYFYLNIDEINENTIVNNDSDEDLLNVNLHISRQKLVEIIQSLPLGYRMIFNLFVIEGLTHKEISNLLNITEGTSKSQLSKARKLLKKKLNELNNSIKND